MALEALLFWLVAALVVAQLLVWLVVYSRVVWGKLPSGKPHQHPISVIIVGRNEAENWRTNLPLFCNQEYPNFEVVAVNDRSVDESEEVLEAMQKQFKHLKVVAVQENDKFWNGKKYGLTLGIKAASNELLLFSDADCKPSSAQWLAYLAQGFSKDRDVVLAHGALERTKGFVNALSRWETQRTALSYMGWSMLGMTYMGVGRNMGYKRELFYANRGFANHMNLPSGDDDLFINEVAKKRKVSIRLHPKAHTLSPTRTTFNSWIAQKTRHLSTSRYYKPVHKLILGSVTAVDFVFWPSLIAAALLLPLNPVLAGLVAARFAFSTVVLAVGRSRLGQADLAWRWIYLEPVLLFSLVLVQFKVFFSPKPKYWT